MDIGQPTIDAIVVKGQPLMVDAEEVKDGGVEIRDCDLVLSHEVSDFVATAMMVSGTDTGPGEETGEGTGMMVASRGIDALGRRAPAEFGGPDEEGVLQHAPLLEVVDQGGHGSVHGGGLGIMVFAKIFVSVPINPGAAEGAAIEKLDETHPALQEATGEQAIAGETFIGRVIQAVEVPDGLRFGFNTHGFGDADLHAGGEFIGPKAGGEGLVARLGAGKIAVHLSEELQIGGPSFCGQAGRRFEMSNRGTGTRPKPHSLMIGRQKAGGPVDRTACRKAAGVWQDDESRQVLVDRAQPIAQPGPHAGKAIQGEPRVHLEGGRGMIITLGGHRMDEAKVIHTSGEMR